jgi:hypothetical protein
MRIRAFAVSLLVAAGSLILAASSFACDNGQGL